MHTWWRRALPKPWRDSGVTRGRGLGPLPRTLRPRFDTQKEERTMRLQNKVAVVTGAGSGMGRAIARRLAEEGATIAVADINEAGMQATVKELTDRGGKAIGMKVDVSKREDVQRAMQGIIDQLGQIDILVNDAGVTRHRQFLSLSGEDWDYVLGVDLKGVFFCSQAVAPHMVSRRYGKILNISSISGTGASSHAAGGSPAGNAGYAAAKAGVIQLTKTLARELGPHGINVNSVAPGFVLTAMTGTTRNEQEVKEHIAARASMAVLGRTGTPEDIANVVLFFVSDESGFVTGQTLYVDGGRTDRM
jgi:3-oxoacyl-[acyl-carrier protein] reductase